MKTVSRFTSSIAIADRKIGTSEPPYLIAELSGNHNGDLQRAFKLMDAAKEAGADAAKLQTYTADTITMDSRNPEFMIEGGLWHGRSLYELYQEAHTPWEWHPALFEYGRRIGLTVFSSPFDTTAVDLLQDLGAPAYKIASFEVVDLPLIEQVARCGKPVIMSTGMATDTEVAEALDVIAGAGNSQVVLLHCVSGYPTPPIESNLRRIPAVAQMFGTSVGLSDHSMGTSVPIASIALGATVIEKHVTLRRADGGPDGAFSLEPEEFREMAVGVRTAWDALGSAASGLKPSESENIIYRRSLYVVSDVRAGEAISQDNVRSIRPGHGLPPKFLKEVLGRRALRDLKRGTPLTWEDVGGQRPR
jgi:N-acetylneuraminate synthase